MTREVPLTRGFVAIVDDEDFDRVSRFRWCLQQGAKSRTAYATRREAPNSPKIWMHRWLLDAPDDVQVDHRNGNGLDNRRSNIRLCTPSQNATNRIRTFANKSSSFVGVHRQRSRWVARIVVALKRVHLGVFASEIDAARCYDRAALVHHGDFAVTNFPKEDYK